MIVIDRVSKTFPGERKPLAKLAGRPNSARQTALNDVSLTVARGELVGLLGANGAGKTTLLQILATLSLADAGTVTIDGVDVATQPARVRRSIGYCGSADRGFYYRLTARENLTFFGAVSRQIARPQAARRIDSMLEQLGLTDGADRLYAHLSTGMRQRLAVARALLGDPPVILFDEPTRAVDPLHARTLRALIRSRLVGQFGKTVLLATNTLEEAWEYCDRIAVLRDGRIVACDTPERLSRLHRRGVRYRFVVEHIEDATLARIRTVPGFLTLDIGSDGDRRHIDVELERDGPATDALLRAVAAGDVAILAMSHRAARPADVFANLVGES